MSLVLNRYPAKNSLTHTSPIDLYVQSRSSPLRSSSRRPQNTPDSYVKTQPNHELYWEDRRSEMNKRIQGSFNELESLLKASQKPLFENPVRNMYDFTALARPEQAHSRMADVKVSNFIRPDSDGRDSKAQSFLVDPQKSFALGSKSHNFRRENSHGNSSNIRNPILGENGSAWDDHYSHRTERRGIREK